MTSHVLLFHKESDDNEEYDKEKEVTTAAMAAGAIVEERERHGLEALLRDTKCRNDLSLRKSQTVWKSVC